jgi:DNA-dependent protein kinase catalytic subunit
MLTYFLKKLEKLLNVEKPDCDSICCMYNTMMRTLFPESSENIQGAVFGDIEEFRKQLKEAEVGIKSGNKEVIKNLMVLKKGVERKSWRPCRKLNDYSPWLSDFQAGRYSSLDLEIPGQYTGESKPLIQHHIKIVSFKQTVSVQIYVILLNVIFQIFILLV